METFFESGAGLAVIAVIGMVGFLTKLFADIKINKLLKQSRNMGETKDRQLRLWRARFENTYRMNRGMNNVLVFIRKNFRQYRIFGMPIQNFDRINVTLACIIAIASLGFSALAVWRDMRTDVILIYCLAGVFCAGVMLVWERICSTREKEEFIVTNIQDYYENSLMRRLELGNELRNSDNNTDEWQRTKKFTPVEEKTINRGQDRMVRRGVSTTVESFDENGADSENERVRKDVEYLKKSFDRIAAGREPEYVQPTRKLTESEEKLIEEFIKEYLN